MKFFQRTQKILAAMGFTRNQQQNYHGKLNFRQMVFVFVCTINALLLVFYIFFVANTMAEYMDAIFSLTVLVGVEMVFISFIFKNDDIFTGFDFCERILTESKCDYCNFQLQKKIEKKLFQRIEEKSSITSKTQENQSTYRKIVWNFLFCRYQGWHTSSDVAESNYKLYHLLYHRCRSCVIWTTICGVVSFCIIFGSLKFTC